MSDAVTVQFGPDAVTIVGVAQSGPAGPGLPAGGTSGQVAIKASATNFDTAWHTLTAADVGADAAGAASSAVAGIPADGAATTASLRTLGTGATQAAVGADLASEISRAEAAEAQAAARGVLYLPGAASNNATSPNTAALQITGDIDVRVKLAMDDWTPATLQTVASKHDDAGNQQGWRLEFNSPGTLLFRWSSDGTSTTFHSAISTVPVSATNGAPLWVRATLDVDNGAGGWTVTFYTSPDGVAWTQLGATVTGTPTTSIFACTAPLEVGTRNAGSVYPLAGRVWEVQLYSGIAGELVYNPRFAHAVTNWACAGTTMRDTTGRVTTINGDLTQWRYDTIPPGHAIVLFGDSITASYAYNLSPGTAGTGWYMGAQAMAVHPFDPPTNSGIGGNTLTQLRARIATDVLAFRPNVVHFLGGANDIPNYRPAADMLNDAQYIVDTILAAGARVLLGTVYPTVAMGGDASMQSILSAYNSGLRNIASTTSGVTLVDYNAAMSANGVTIDNAAYLIDGVHPAILGSAVMSRTLAPQMRQ